MFAEICRSKDKSCQVRISAMTPRSRACGSRSSISVEVDKDGIVEKKMETTGMIGLILGLYRDNGKENGNYGDYRVHIGIIQG